VEKLPGIFIKTGFKQESKLNIFEQVDNCHSLLKTKRWTIQSSTKSSENQDKQILISHTNESLIKLIKSLQNYEVSW